MHEVTLRLTNYPFSACKAVAQAFADHTGESPGNGPVTLRGYPLSGDTKNLEARLLELGCTFNIGPRINETLLEIMGMCYMAGVADYREPSFKMFLGRSKKIHKAIKRLK